MSAINRIFLKGLFTLLPIALTIYILYSAVIILENLLGSLLRAILPASTYIPGFGVLATLLVIFLFGLLINNYLTARFMSWFEEKFKQIPFIKAIYSPLSDLMNLFSKTGDKGMKGVVLVELGQSGAQAIGIITREQFKDIPGNHLDDKVAVYFPLSYGVGGLTFMIPRSKITRIDIPVEKAMSLAITGWVKS